MVTVYFAYTSKEDRVLGSTVEHRVKALLEELIKAQKLDQAN